MKAFKGKTVEFTQEKPEEMLVYNVQKLLLGKINLGKKPNYVLRTEQNAEFSSEQLAEISKGMHD